MKPAVDSPVAADDAPPAVPPWHDRLGLATVAVCLVIITTTWYLLKEFAPLLRPLFLAVFLSYIIFPTHRRLTQRIPRLASIAVLAGVTVAVLILLTLLLLSNAAQLSEEMPRLLARAQALLREAERYYLDHVPPWALGEPTDFSRGERPVGNLLKYAAAELARTAADTVPEAVLVGIYLVFLLIEARRVPERVQGAFTGERPARILAVVQNINDAMASYLRVKVKASLVIALPVTLVLSACGVEFAMMWGVLTFLLNFVPYLGSIIACTGPIFLAFLQMDGFVRPAVVLVLLVSLHTLSAYLIEPAMTGKAVDLSPLVILVALSFWGLCWGLTGMLLAVPLTVMLKIVLENVAFTRPFARMMAEE